MSYPLFGALPEKEGVRFRIMGGVPGSPAARRLQVVLHSGRAAGAHDLEHVGEGVYDTWIEGASPGDRYSYRLNESGLRPDPASRFQPQGVHGPSEIIDPARYAWHDLDWRGCSRPKLVIYELHVGTFTPEGTFDGVRRRLPLLRELGVTAVEIMPVADFAGTRNWGYDGACLFAPSRAYGRPDDFRALVDDAHALGLGVILDVVYNHLGPEGAYLPQFNEQYVTDLHSTPWGGAINLDGPGSKIVREFIVDNAVHWMREYHLDGLRLDATHALIDNSPVHLVAELAANVRRAAAWPVILHAEDHRNLAAIVEPRDHGGWGLDGLWADDFHHIVRRLIAGDAHGYYQDFDGTAEELTRTIRQGWLYTGQTSKHMKQRRGTDPSQIPMQRFVVCLQNHDQVGNRAVGDRLHHRIEPAAWRAASALLLTAPMTPLLFMGQEWAASTPFLYFTDMEPGLGRAITEGRRREFKDFPGFADDPRFVNEIRDDPRFVNGIRDDPRSVNEIRDDPRFVNGIRDDPRTIPDPQAVSTFEASRLRWEERGDPPHASTLALYRALLALRTAHPALQASDRVEGEAWTEGGSTIVMRRSCGSETFVIVASFRDGADVNYQRQVRGDAKLEVVLTTEDEPFAPDPQPPQIELSSVRFHRPGATIFRGKGPHG